MKRKLVHLKAARYMCKEKKKVKWNLSAMLLKKPAR